MSSCSKCFTYFSMTYPLRISWLAQNNAKKAGFGRQRRPALQVHYSCSCSCAFSQSFQHFALALERPLAKKISRIHQRNSEAVLVAEAVSAEGVPAVPRNNATALQVQPSGYTVILRCR